MYRDNGQCWLKHMDFIVWDVLCLHIAYWVANMISHGPIDLYDVNEYFCLAAVFTLVDLLILVVNQTMEDVLMRSYYKEMEQTLCHVFYVTVLVSLFMVAADLSVTYSRVTFFLIFGYYAMFSYALRLIWKEYLLKKNSRICSSSVYVITTQDRAAYVVKRFSRNNDSGRKIHGMCILDKDCTDSFVGCVKVTATAANVMEHLCRTWVDEVFISLPVSCPLPEKLMSDLAELGIVVHLEIDQPETAVWQYQSVENFAGATVRTMSMTMTTPFQAAMKRMIDILGGLVGCIITCILVVVIGPLIYMKSPGPIFFQQTRVGKNGKKFQMYKFRSMYLDAEKRKAELMAQNRMGDGLMFKLEEDPRIIGCRILPDGTYIKGIGNYIRDYSLDEFPQFFNVLKGDISLCGTRPPTVDEWEKYELHHHARLAIKPGITGLWQVSGRSNITDFEKVVELDKKYIREWSLGLDFRILLQTIKVVLCRDGSM